MTVDNSIIYIYMLAIGYIDELVMASDMSGSLRQGHQNQKFGIHRLPALGAEMPERIKDQPVPHHGLVRSAGASCSQQAHPADQSADAFYQQLLREQFADVVIRPHAQTQQLVPLVILRGQENNRHGAVLAQALQPVRPENRGLVACPDPHGPCRPPLDDGRSRTALRSPEQHGAGRAPGPGGYCQPAGPPGPGRWPPGPGPCVPDGRWRY
ncbi:MAG: hypothetical protein FD153_1684 [Rhodospirillaceae bacterium]|nr:MAG: hypothetical protein FD153_1684 [Rhodospirillaceae bacterium]